MKKLLTLIVYVMAFCTQATEERNLVLVTVDGLRWQEIFQGKQQTLIENEKLTPHKNALIDNLALLPAEEAKSSLMPFLWGTVARKGTIIGDRTILSNMSVANQWYFSYPGYSEIFTGVTNPKLNSNAKVDNPEISFLEWLSHERGYKDIAAFGSWDVFPYILNTKRSKLYVNAGFTPATLSKHSEQIKLLNDLQQEIPSPWHNVRLDAFTHRFAVDYLKKNKPRVLAISYGETDDFAHDGKYDEYLKAAHRTDKFIDDLWQTLQSIEQYKNNTNLIIVSDHGRGSNTEDWQYHASANAVKSNMKRLSKFEQGIVGSEHIWMAALGPDIRTQGIMQTGAELYQKQIAATALTLLGEDYRVFNANAGQPIQEIIK